MRVCTSKFTYNPKNKGFVAEASDLGTIDQEIFHPIYPDACDPGITLISEKTGKHADYFLYRTERSANEDRELLYWTLHPTAETLRRLPALRGTYVTIFND